MGPVEMKVVYDQQQYYSGQTLSGNVLVKLNEPLPITVIKVRTLGEGRVSWTVKTQRTTTNYVQTGTMQSTMHHQTTMHHHTTTQNRTVSKQEKYIDVKTVLFESVSGEGFGGGEHRFRFSVQLPPNLPSSFDVGKKMSAKGCIGYACRATLKSTKNISLLSSKCKVLEPFMLIGMAPSPLGHVGILSEQDTQKIPFFGECCMLVTAGEVKATISVNKSNFLAGETVLVKAEVEHLSKKTLNSIRFSIKQKIDLHANSASRYHEEDTDSFLDWDQGPLMPGGKLSLDGIRLTVPHLPSTIEGAAQVLFVRYFAAVTLSQGRTFCPSKVGFRVPITIGPTSLAQVGPQASIGYPPSYTEAVVTSQPTAFNENDYYKQRY